MIMIYAYIYIYNLIFINKLYLLIKNEINWFCNTNLRYIWHLFWILNLYLNSYILLCLYFRFPSIYRCFYYNILYCFRVVCIPLNVMCGTIHIIFRKNKSVFFFSAVKIKQNVSSIPNKLAFGMVPGKYCNILHCNSIIYLLSNLHNNFELPDFVLTIVCTFFWKAWYFLYNYREK